MRFDAPLPKFAAALAKGEPVRIVALGSSSTLGLEFEWMNTTFFLSRETILATKAPGMAMWRERLFSFLSRNKRTPAS